MATFSSQPDAVFSANNASSMSVVLAESMVTKGILLKSWRSISSVWWRAEIVFISSPTLAGQ